MGTYGGRRFGLELAAFFIQKRFKVLQAKKEARARKADAQLRSTNAGALIAQTQGVSLLEKMLTRHRASRTRALRCYLFSLT